MAQDFTIGNRQFKANRLDVFRQFHVVRKIAPILGDLLPVMERLSKLNEEQLKEDQIEMLQPIMNGIARLSDKDADFVLLGLLSAVEVKQEAGNWAKLSDGKTLFFQDLDLPTMLQVAGRAFQFNLSGFFNVLPQVSPGRG